MPRLTIDDRPIEVTEGSTILDAARRLGIDIPTLCHLDGYESSTSCMLCLVKVKSSRRLVPSCATLAEDGMEIENDTEEIRSVRRSGLELILSDHTGDCTAPCQNTCPVDMDIPRMLSQVDARQMRDAIATIKEDISMPAVLGRVCPELCEKGCRRSDIDGPASICLVKQHVADVDLASDSPYVPTCALPTGKRVAIIGAGPAGLTAAYQLQRAGHACTVFDQAPEPGGMLRARFSEEQLPRRVLEGEIAIIERMGARFEMGTRVDTQASLHELTDRFDAVLLATGRLDEGAAEHLGLAVKDGRLQADSRTQETPVAGVFAAGEVVHPTDLVVRCVAAGKSAAYSIDDYLHGSKPMGKPRTFTVRAGRLNEEELIQLTVGTSDAGRVTPSQGRDAGLSAEEALSEAHRCLHCECAQHDDCRLRRYALEYGASATRYGRRTRPLERYHRNGGVVFEPGKCILCGLCIQVATRAREPLGLTFIGRGFDMQLGVPFDRTIEEGLRTVGNKAAEACPTGALAVRS